MPQTTVPGQTPEAAVTTQAQPADHDRTAELPALNGSAPRSSGVAAPASSGRAGSVVRTLLIVLVILGAVGGAIWKIRKNRAEVAAAPSGPGRTAGGPGGGGPTPVLVTSVQQRTVPVYLTALGTVTAYNSVTIKSRVDGQLLSVNVREGQTVRKGQLLAEIDPRPYQAAVAQAEGQLAKDQATSANAQAEAGRYTALYSAGVISKESQQTQVANAGQASGSLQADQAAIQAAKVNVVYTRIASPIEGIVGLRTVDPGNIVHAGDTNGLILVTQVHPISVIFTLPEDQLPQVLKLTRSGAKLSVEAYDRSESQHLASGTLLTVDNTIDTTTGTAKIKAVFPNSDNALFPNQFVNVRLIVQQRQDALVVPSAAIQQGSNGNFLYVVRKGNPPAGQSGAPASGPRRKPSSTVAVDASAPVPDAVPSPAAGRSGGAGNREPFYVDSVPVKIALTQGSSTVVEGGIKGGDQVVIDGQERLKPFTRVVPRQADAPANRSGGAPGAGNGGTLPGNAITSPAGAPPAGQNGTGTAQPSAGRQP